ncbi:hypothetical protein NLU13_6111 [Sarocladium strictum]|uniref:Major facilitator superfamily (MFS) profile domain-containing protein n=1 Tax=Sarocladium strictum TaxID=5046 RepID=A0AA39GGV2_SARSR|nr:hypothetical protein NLU13_6111 [Sarocladium strictum]
MSSLLGPTLGGAITSHTTWRRVFWSNIPPGVTAILALAVVFPKNARPMNITRRHFAMMDYLGMISYLIGSTMLVFASEEGGLVYAWHSPVIIVAFSLSAAAFVFFMAWEWRLSGISEPTGSVLSLFPMYLTRQRIIAFSFLTAFLAGFPFLVLIVFLPQRFQLMYGLSAMDAGVRPCCFRQREPDLVASCREPATSAATYSSDPLCLQLIGLGLMTTLSTTSREFSPAIFGFQVILGLGFGLTLSCVVIVAQTEVKHDPDVVITISAITQIRVLGGVIGVAMAQAILNHQLTTSLTGKVPSEKIEALLRSASAIRDFTPEQAASTANYYGKRFDLQYEVILGLSGAALLTGIGCWQRRPANFSEIQKRRPKGERISEPTPCFKFVLARCLHCALVAQPAAAGGRFLPFKMALGPGKAI